MIWRALYGHPRGDKKLTDQFRQPLELRDAQGQATSDWSSIVTARLTTDQQNVFEFELFAGCTNPKGTKDGRVVSLKDRWGRGLTQTYKTWTAAELQKSQLTCFRRANPDHERFAKHLQRHAAEFFTVLRQPNVEATNYRAD